MGLRFRKSIKIAPGVKINLNKNSVSTTVGTKGAHYTVNSKGKKTASVGIPGTGVSYSSSSGGTTAKSNRGISSGTCSTNNPTSPNKKKGRGCLTAFIIMFFIGGICSLFTDNNDITKLSISANTDVAYDINTDIPISVECDPSNADLKDIKYNTSGGKINNDNGVLSFTSDTAGNYTVYISSGDIKSNSLTFEIEDKAAIEEAQKIAEEEARKKAEEEAAAQAAAETEAQKQSEAQSQEPQEEMVWIPSSGSKYHSRSSCSGMDNPRQVTLSEAESMGYTPCKKCH